MGRVLALILCLLATPAAAQLGASPGAGAASDAALSTTNTDLGAPGATACATDTGSCSLNALTQRINQRLTSVLSALASVPVTGTFWPVTQPVSGTFWQTTQPVSGTFWQTTQPVSGTFWQATQPVSGTFWQATQPVSGTFWQATQPVSGTVQVGNTPNTSPILANPNQLQPSGATQESCASGNVAAGTTACTLATAVGKTTYIAGFSMTASGATAGLAVNCTLSGLITGTQTYIFTYPAGVLVGAAPLTVAFSPPLPASATNTTIVASCPSGGSGAAHAAMNAWGYQL